MYGTGALLLLVNATGFLMQRKGRPAWLSIVSLAAAILGLAAIAIYATFDLLESMGIGRLVDEYWYALMIALLLVVLGISIYAITASLAGRIPSWAALPFAFCGLALVLITLIFATGLFNLTFAFRDFVNNVSLALLFGFFALWGAVSIAGLLTPSSEGSTSPGISPRPGIST
jgi:hypothetical protein